MSNFEYQDADDEVIGMVNEARRGRPTVKGYFFPEEEARRAMVAMNTMETPVETVEPSAYNDRQKNLIRATGCVVRTIPAVTFFIGASEGLMNLYFAGACAVPFLLWAVVHWLNN